MGSWDLGLRPFARPSELLETTGSTFSCFSSGSSGPERGSLLKVTQHGSHPPSWARVPRACPSAPCTHDAHLSRSQRLTRWASHRRQATWTPQARVGRAEAHCPRPQVPSQCFTLSLETTHCLAGSGRGLWRPQVKKHITPTRGLCPGDDPVKNRCTCEGHWPGVGRPVLGTTVRLTPRVMVPGA